MANTFSGFLQTLVARADELSTVVYGENNIVDKIYKDISTTEVSPGVGYTVNVNVPNKPTFTDVGVGSLSPTTLAPTVIPIVMSQHRSASYKIADFEQFNSPQSLVDTFIDPLINGALADINKQAAALITTSNFGTSLGTNLNGLITTADYNLGITKLREAFCPMSNPDDVTLFVPPFTNGKMSVDGSWADAVKAGDSIASSIRSTGQVGKYAFGTNVKIDQDVPVSGSAGSRIWTCALLHKWAIALAVRPMPSPKEGSNVEVVQTVWVKGIPIRFMISYLHSDFNYIVSCDVGFGLAKMRSEFAAVYTTKEASA